MTTEPICKLLCKKGAVQELCGLENTPKTRGQTSQSKMATIWRLVWQFTSGWIYLSVSSWLLAKMVHLERCGISGFDLNIKSEAGCICMAWYGVKPTASWTM